MKQNDVLRETCFCYTDFITFNQIGQGLESRKGLQVKM